MDFILYIDPEQKRIAVRNGDVSMDFPVHTIAQWSGQLPPKDVA
ncbi:MAG: hypothetical protein ACYC4K_07755 [Thiobacillus sp.]